MTITVEVQVNKIERADGIAYAIRVRNDGTETIPAGGVVGVFGRVGAHGAPQRVWSTTVTRSLAPGEVFEASTYAPMSSEEARMERFTARLLTDDDA